MCVTVSYISSTSFQMKCNRIPVCDSDGNIGSTSYHMDCKGCVCMKFFHFSVRLIV